jgi:DNA-binding response OmpR family regulator
MPMFMPTRRHRVEGIPRQTVIIVDREPLYRWFVSESLDAHGLHAIQCRTVGEAVAFARRRLPIDLILVDEHTMQEEGAMALDLLRDLARSITCLVLDSAGPDSPMLDIGEAALVEKPVDSEGVVALVNRNLDRSARSA